VERAGDSSDSGPATLPEIAATMTQALGGRKHIRTGESRRLGLLLRTLLTGYGLSVDDQRLRGAQVADLAQVGQIRGRASHRACCRAQRATVELGDHKLVTTSWAFSSARSSIVNSTPQVNNIISQN
jgi:hypothetical protein